MANFSNQIFLILVPIGKKSGRSCLGQKEIFSMNIPVFN